MGFSVLREADMGNGADFPLWMLVVSIAAGFVIFFSLLWYTITSLVAKLSGWPKLAKRFAVSDIPDHLIAEVVTGFIGAASYKNCLHVRPTDKGLYLSVSNLVARDNTPLFIPWGEMHDIYRRQYRRQPYIGADIGRPSIAAIQLPERFFALSPFKENA
jgi:hypothetical protein